MRVECPCGSYNPPVETGPVAGEILHLSASTVYGGGEEHLRVLLTELARRNRPLALACPPRAPLRGRLSGCDVRLLDWGPYPAADPRAARDLERLVGERLPALVHSHNPLEDLAASSLRILGRTVPVVTTVHDRINMDGEGRRRTDPNARIYLHILGTGFDRILAVSEATRRDLIDYAGISPHRVRAIVNGTSFARIDSAPPRDEARRRLGIPADAVAFGMGARVATLDHRKKGVDLFLEAAGRVLEKDPRARAWVVGLGSIAMEQARAALAELPALDRIVLTPFVDEYPAYLAAWDFSVLPSRFEGLPRGLVEAMAAGLPVVASRVDGIVEALSPDAGILVEPEDIEGLAAAIRTLVSDGDLRRRMGAAARAWSRAHFSVERMADDVEAAYRELLP